MPYIVQDRRKPLLEGAVPEHTGELNFLFTNIFIDCFNKRKMEGMETRLWNAIYKFMGTKELRYAMINDIVGAYVGAQLEFFTRIIPTVDEEDYELADYLAEFDDQSTDFLVKVYGTIATPYEKKKIKENGDVYNIL